MAAVQRGRVAATQSAAQLALFELEDRSQVHLIALYDLAPRFVFPAGARGEKDKIAARSEKKAQPQSIHRRFAFDDQRYNLTLLPAVIFRRRTEDGALRHVANPLPEEMSSVEAVEAFPGEREQIIEQVVRRLAMDRSRLSLSGDESKEADRPVTMRFSLYDIRRELRAINHSCDYTDIRESLTILARSRIVLSKAAAGSDGKRSAGKLLDSTAFPELAISTRPDLGDEEEETYLTFNALVATAIRKLEFRPISYQWMMRLKNPVSRWVYNRLAAQYMHGGTGSTAVSADDIIENSGMNAWSRRRDTLRAVTSAVESLVKEGILSHVEINCHKVSNRIEGIDYVVTPSPAFLEQVRLSTMVSKANADTFREYVENKPAEGYVPVTQAQAADLRRRRSSRLTALEQQSMPTLPFDE